MHCPKCQIIHDQGSVFCTCCGQQLQQGSQAATGQCKTVITIGRGDTNTIVVNHSQVSWEHARLTMDVSGQWWVEDLGSTNGTFLNDRTQKISRQQVSNTDLLFLGSQALRLDQVLTSPQQPRQKSVKEQAVSGATISIGRGDENDLIVDYPQVSWKHARVFKDESGTWWAEDLDSANGTYINDRHQKISRQQLHSGDVLYLGSYKIAFDRIIAGYQKSAGHSIMLGGYNARPITAAPDKPLLIGRDPDADIHLDVPQVSWHHARLIPQDDNQWLLQDLDSSNGIFVNGQQVVKQLVRAGDEIGLGSHVFQLTAGRRLLMQDYRGDFRLDAQNITVVTQNGKMLLNDVNFTVYPSEFVGLMGLAGAGKTTLFLAMNGYRKPTSGTSCLNGHDLYQNYDQFKDSIGYVPQKDVLHGELTVEETLYYSARLRLPSDTRDNEIHQRIEKVLTELDLINPEENLDVRKVIIGTSIKNGISCGQLKRVNLAIELLADPGILFLDEPTSGLSAVDNIMVMRLLRKLADEGKTIVLVVHQPDIESYKLMDNVIIIDQGELVFYGPCWPDSITFFNPDKEPDQILERAEMALLGLDEQKAGTSCRNRFEQSHYYSEYVTKRQQDQKNIVAGDNQKRNLQKTWFNLTHFKTMTSRFLCCKLKDTINTTILLAQAPIIATLIALVFNDQQGAPTIPLFMLAISALWLGTSNAAREIVSEFPIYERERMAGVGIPEYLMSKFSVLSGLCLFQCLVLVAITHQFIEIQASWAAVFAITLLCSLVGLSMGLLLSTLTRTSAAALALVPVVILPSVIVGGGLRCLSRMDDISLWLANLMPSRWGYEALIQLETDKWDINPITNESLLETVFSSHALGLAWSCSILSGYVLVFMLLAGVALKMKDNL